MTHETSILLPSATVDFFVKDAQTVESAKALSSDWRFARVAVNIHGGGVEGAIEYFAKGQASDIIMIETDVTDESFTDRLGVLSSHCHENTSAIVIGPVNDVNLYRSLTSMGVSDYLVRPVPSDTLAEVIAQTLIQKLGAAGARLVAVMGAKGGIGVSSVAQLLGAASSGLLGQKTLLFDAAGAWSSLGVGLGFEPVAGTAEALRAAGAKDMDSLRRVLYQADEKFFVLATGAEPMLDSGTQGAEFESFIDVALSSHPVVIADLSSAPPALQKTILGRAHGIILLSAPTLPSLRNARSLINEIRKIFGGQDKNIDLVINMAGMGGGKDIPAGDIKNALDMEPFTTIPFDPKLFMGAENEGRQLIKDKAGEEIARSLLPLLKKAAGLENAANDDRGAGLLGSLLGRIKSRK
ncbi:MAG: type II secretion protein ATPase [Micavibrio sp.]